MAKGPDDMEGPVRALTTSLGRREQAHVHFSPPPSPPRRSPAPSPSKQDWSRTSFKLTKSKPSKTRYLTKGEVIGISVSVLLSILIALVIGATILLAAPVMYQQAANFIDDVVYLASMAKGGDSSHSTALKKPPPSRIRAGRNLTAATFTREVLHSRPALFNTNVSSSTLSSFYAILSDASILSQALDAKPLAWFALPQVEGGFGAFSESVGARELREWLRDDVSLDTALSMDAAYFVASDSLVTRDQLLPIQTCSADEFVDPKANAFFREASNTVRVSLGRHEENLSGTPFHCHTQRLNLLLEGTKRWVLFPPDNGPIAGFNPLWNLQRWLAVATSDEPESSKHKIEFIQHAGQWVYVPDGWLHATMTISPHAASLSFTGQSPQRSSFLYYLHEGDRKRTRHDLDGAVRMYKLGLGLARNDQLFQRLGDALVEQRSFIAAEEVYNEAIKANPRNPISYAKLVELMVVHGSRDVTHEIAGLLAQAQVRGIRDDVLSLAHNSLL